MKILHFADVHFDTGTLDDLSAPCREIVSLAKSERFGAIVIAGDLTTQRGVISNAVAVHARAFVSELAHIAPVFVLAGNHDLTFRDGEPNNLRAILSDLDGAVYPNVKVIDQPETHLVRDGAREIALHFLPYPNLAMFHAATGGADFESVNDALADVVNGLASKALPTAFDLLVYHGTVEGGRTGDESAPALRTRGEDVVIPTALLRNFHGVLCGHLHHPQTIDYGTGQAVYPGCVTPLTFGERSIEPGVVIWTIDGETIEHTRHPLPVAHQRLQAEIGPDDWDEGADAAVNLSRWISALSPPLGPPYGSRVKVKATLPKQRLELLTADLIDSARNRHGLDRLVIERTPLETSKIRLGEGEDRAARVNVVESLAAFGEYIEDPAYVEHLQDIQRVGREIEEQMASDSSDPHYHFEPVALELQNYKQFADVSLDFHSLPRRAGVLGPTGAGKSNLILAIYAALYGGNPKDEAGKAKTSLGDMVRRGERQARVRLDFVSGGVDYRITRNIKVDTSGRGSSSLHLERIDEGRAVSLNAGTARDTQAVIEALVGPPELHWLTRHLRQHGVSVVKMTAADLTDAINATLQLDFGARLDRAKQMRRDAVAIRDTEHGRIEQLGEQIVPLDTIEKQEKHARALLDKASGIGAMAHANMEGAQADYDKEREHLEQISARLATYEDRAARLDAVEDKIRGAEAEAADVHAKLDTLAPAADLVALEAAVAECRDRETRARHQVHGAREALAAHNLDDAQTFNGLNESRQAVANKRAEAHRLIRSLQTRMDDMAKRAALLDDVPCRGDRWHDPENGEMDGGACALLADAAEARDRIATISRELEKAKADYEAIEEDHQAALRAVGEHKAEAQKIRDGLESEVRAADAAASTAADALARAVRDLDRARDGESLRGPLVQQLARIEQRLTVLREQADGLSVNRANLDEHRHAVHIQRGTVQRLQREAEKWRNEMMEARERIARLEADLEQLDLERMQRDRAVRDLDDAKRRRDEAERRRVALDYYRQAVDRGGIPSLLLEQLAPQLQARVNDILSPVGRQIRIDTERVTTTGRTKTEVTLRLMSPTSGNEFVPIAEASGGEEDLLNMAMSAGLARVASDMSGAPLSFVALDEPAAGVSESLQAETLEVIGRVHEHVQRSLTITHRRDLAAAFDGVIEVQQNGAGSTVEVQR